MAQSLLQHGAIRTTEPKAKELRRFVEKLITTARRGTLHARRLVAAEMRDRLMVDAKGELQDKTVLQKLFDEIAPRYADRPGGYTRIIRLSDRRIGDAGVQVLMQLVEAAPAAQAEEGARSSRRRRRAGKRRERLESAQAARTPASEAEGQTPAEGGAASEPADQKPAEEKSGDQPQAEAKQ
jgi:large subunit ribosomal protein L17